MAKYEEGQDVRATRNIRVGSVLVRVGNYGEIEKISGLIGKKKYKIRWRAAGITIEHNGSNDFTEVNA